MRPCVHHVPRAGVSRQLNGASVPPCAAAGRGQESSVGADGCFFPHFWSVSMIQSAGEVHVMSLAR